MTNFEFVTRLMRSAMQAEENLGVTLKGHGMIFTLLISAELTNTSSKEKKVNISLIDSDVVGTDVDDVGGLTITSDRKLALDLIIDTFDNNNPIKVGLFEGLSDIEALEKLEELAFNA